jgi:hypothetical protein
MSCKVGRPILIKKKANVVGWEIKGKELVFRCAPSIARPVREQVISSPIFSGINIPIVSVDVTTSGTWIDGQMTEVGTGLLILSDLRKGRILTSLGLYNPCSKERRSP